MAESVWFYFCKKILGDKQAKIANDEYTFGVKPNFRAFEAFLNKETESTRGRQKNRSKKILSELHQYEADDRPARILEFKKEAEATCKEMGLDLMKPKRSLIDELALVFLAYTNLSLDNRAEHIAGILDHLKIGDQNDKDLTERIRRSITPDRFNKRLLHIQEMNLRLTKFIEESVRDG